MKNGKKMVAKLAKGIADNALKRNANQTKQASDTIGRGFDLRAYRGLSIGKRTI